MLVDAGRLRHHYRTTADISTQADTKQHCQYDYLFV